MMLIGMLNTLFVFDEPPYQVVAPEGADKLKELAVCFIVQKIRLYVQVTNLLLPNNHPHDI